MQSSNTTQIGHIAQLVAFDERSTKGQVRRDPFTGTRVVYVPGRGAYKSAMSGEKAGKHKGGGGRDASTNNVVDCPFCGEQVGMHNAVVFENDNLVVIRNRFTYLPEPEQVQIVIFPRQRHVTSVSETTAEEMSEVGDWILSKTRENRHAVGFVNYGPESTGSVAHLHWQLMLLKHEPAAQAAEAAALRKYSDTYGGEDLFDALRHYEIAHDTRIIQVTDTWVTWMPWWSDTEVLILPREGATFATAVVGQSLRDLLSSHEALGADSAAWWLHANHPEVPDHLHVRLDIRKTGTATSAAGFEVLTHLPRTRAQQLRETLADLC